MNIQPILDYDKQLLIAAQSILPNEFSLFVTIFAESIVIWCMILLIGLWLYGVKQKDNSYKITSLHIFGLIISVFLIYSVINLMVPQWREHPHEFLLHSRINPLIPHPTDNSFPSGHALFSGAFIVAIFSYFRKSWTIILTITLAIATVSFRVLGGVHYPGDIVAGLIIGIIGAIIFKPFVEKIIEKISPYLIKIASYIKL